MLDAAENATDGRATRWDAHKAQRRLEVLDAAVELIEAEGPAIGVKQIADRVGLPRPVVYRHFRDRDDLDEQIRARVIEKLMRDLAPSLSPEGTVGAAVDRAVRTYLGWIEAHPKLHHFLGTGAKAERAGGGSKIVSSTKTAIAVQVSGLFGLALSRIDTDPALAEPLAFGLVGLVDATVNRWLTDPNRRQTPAALADFLTSSILHLIIGHLADLGVEVTPDMPVADLLG
ncbi:TetR/AcrR family transcriptional regulator [Actinokineospora iranica]|uniref:DNA-binding transcriptional regulator, AcrR family n=1 Tax=Actinokineospora iranica TaxID=1271860 RepID=A0A1G6RTR9_9PSEU|nr:TetR/AcrR family transcriptional regulator [Actinokineospora iranica]SDD08032.1 DNA-binding transcriptional regulator, AcrR family [Actinokineospora iranica]